MNSALLRRRGNHYRQRIAGCHAGLGRCNSKGCPTNAELSQLQIDKTAIGDLQNLDQALSIVLLREELVRGVQRVAGSGGVENYFAA